MSFGSVRKPGAANFLNDSTGTFNGTVAELNNVCDLMGGFAEQAAITNVANFAQGMADVNAAANALNANLVGKVNSILAALRLANIIADA